MNQRPSGIGRTLNGRYRIETILGQGGMSAVYKATDPDLKRVVAIKIFHPHLYLSTDPSFALQFEREAATVARLRHPNIVQVFDYNHDENVYYLVMEFIHGETLWNRLQRLSKVQRQQFSMHEVLKFTVDISDALGYAHAHDMIHRDVKPAHIMLSESGQAILTGLGMVQILFSDRLGSTETLIGTASYMSPEVIKGEVADHRSDIYSLGVVLYEMLGGRPPFVAHSSMAVLMMHLNDPVPDVRTFRQDAPTELVRLVKRCLAKDRNDRYQSASQLSADLRRVQSDQYQATPVNLAAPPVKAGASAPPSDSTVEEIDPHGQGASPSLSSNRSLMRRILEFIVGDSTINTPPPNYNKQKQEESKAQSKPAPPKASHKNPDESVDEVSFTAYHPKEGKVDTWHTLLVYAHIVAALETVRKDAQKFEDEIKPAKVTTSKASTQIAQGTDITIVPACAGITFNPAQITFKWAEDFYRAHFRFKADQSLGDDAATGQISIHVGPLIIGTLKFAMLFNETATPSVTEHEEQARMYPTNRIFISYSHKDTDLALMFRNVLEAVGYDVLLDIDDLRAGQVWNDELMRMIERADIFQLFWSQNSSQSEYCRREWEHALKQNKPAGFIRPIYWQKPLPTPPDELSKFHFDYVDLKLPST
jgi:serine/threonine protein kinase